MNAKALAASTTLFLAAAATLIACGTDRVDGPFNSADIIPASVPSCGSAKAVFTTSPVTPQSIMGWVPLGSMNPPGHTFPTDHQYIYLTTFGTTNDTVTLYAPGAITVTQARRVRYLNSAGVQINEDYALDFMPCREISGDFGHVRSITPALLAALGPFDQQCDTYSPAPGTTVADCFTKHGAIAVNAGERIGTTAGLDLSLFDNRVAPLVYANPSRWVTNPTGFDHFHVVAFSDYFAEPARSTVRGLLGSFDGRTRRTIEPLGGTIGSDVAGTAQGVWLNPSQPTYPETPHLSIVPDAVDPTRIAVSIGATLTGIAPGAYLFTPAASGAINRAPSQITPGPSIYCWDVGYSATDQRGIVLVQLVDATTLRAEARANRTCSGEQPWVFEAAAVFVR